jgi:hypothetical protein
MAEVVSDSVNSVYLNRAVRGLLIGSDPSTANTLPTSIQLSHSLKMFDVYSFPTV